MMKKYEEGDICQNLPKKNQCRIYRNSRACIQVNSNSNSNNAFECKEINDKFQLTVTNNRRLVPIFAQRPWDNKSRKDHPTTFHIQPPLALSVLVPYSQLE